MASQANHPLALPTDLSPDSISTVPDLVQTLNRVRLPQSNTTLSGAPTTAVTGTTPLPSQSSAAAPPSSDAHLSIRDIPAATDALKHKIQKARAQVCQLPDMRRSVEEQEAEIKELEEKIVRQKETLAALREHGTRFESGPP